MLVDLSEIFAKLPLIKCNLRHGSLIVRVREIEEGTLAFSLVSSVLKLDQQIAKQTLCSLIH